MPARPNLKLSARQKEAIRQRIVDLYAWWNDEPDPETVGPALDWFCSMLSIERTNLARQLAPESTWGRPLNAYVLSYLHALEAVRMASGGGALQRALRHAGEVAP